MFGVVLKLDMLPRLTLMTKKFFFMLAHSDLVLRYSGREGVDNLDK